MAFDGEAFVQEIREELSDSGRTLARVVRPSERGGAESPRRLSVGRFPTFAPLLLTGASSPGSGAAGHSIGGTRRDEGGASSGGGTLTAGIPRSVPERTAPIPTSVFVRFPAIETSAPSRIALGVQG